MLPSDFLIGCARAMKDTHRTVRKKGGGTQVDHLCTCGYAAAVLCALNDPAISHKSIDTRFRGLFKYFFIGVRTLALLGGAGASRPAFNKIIFIKGLVSFLY
jgi:hypothetical protein